MMIRDVYVRIYTHIQYSFVQLLIHLSINQSIKTSAHTRSARGDSPDGTVDCPLSSLTIQYISDIC